MPQTSLSPALALLLSMLLLLRSSSLSSISSRLVRFGLRLPSNHLRLFSTVSSSQSSSATFLSSPPSISKPTIHLQPSEERLFNLFLQFCQERGLSTVVRVAGGWVRDKLLNTSNKYDIDIALDNMTGKDFALGFNSWIQDKGMAGMQFGVIQQNPDKSKHLETGDP
jgi:hypothetical protein